MEEDFLGRTIEPDFALEIAALWKEDGIQQVIRAVSLRFSFSFCF
jgi:hypothetical protein